MSDTDAARQLAEHVGREMFARDRAVREAGIELREIGAGRAVMSMVVRASMLNGFEICHGGYLTLLADSAFAYACNAGNELTVASGLSIDFLSPGNLDDELIASAVEVARQGRTGLYDVTITARHGRVIARLRGRSYSVKGRPTIPGATG